jgi:hypothetical protein
VVKEAQSVLAKHPHPHHKHAVAVWLTEGRTFTWPSEIAKALAAVPRPARVAACATCDDRGFIDDLDDRGFVLRCPDCTKAFDRELIA